MTQQPLLTVHEAVALLRAMNCQCGGRKSYGHALCRHCYFALPGDLKRDLYLRVGHGFEEQYRRAMDFLRSRRRSLAAGGSR